MSNVSEPPFAHAIGAIAGSMDPKTDQPKLHLRLYGTVIDLNA